MSLENIEKALKNLSKDLSEQFVSAEYETVKQTAEAKKAFKNDIQDNANLNLLTKELQQVRNDLPGTEIDEILNELAVTSLNGNYFSQDLVTKVDNATEKSDLESITGSAKLVADGELTKAFTAPFPQAMADTLKEVTTATKPQINQLLGEVSKASLSILDDITSQTFGNSVSALSKLKSTVSLISSSNALVLSNIAKTGFDGVLVNIIEQVLGNLNLTLNTALVQNGQRVVIPNKLKREIASLIQQGRFRSAAAILTNFSDKSLEEIETLLKNTNITVSDNLAPASSSGEVVDIDDTVNLVNAQNSWKESRTDTGKVFFKVGSTAREISTLVKDFANLKRDVSEVVIYSTPSNKEISIVDLHNLFVSQFDQGLNPHFYINKAGILFRGRPLEIPSLNIGAFSKLNVQHHKHSINITINSEKGISPAQSKSLEELIRSITLAMPGISIYDVNDLGAVPPDPNITDIYKWLKVEFPDRTQVPSSVYNPSEKNSLDKDSLVNLLNGNPATGE